jgi:hypothetical protein
MWALRGGRTRSPRADCRPARAAGGRAQGPTAVWRRADAAASPDPVSLTTSRGDGERPRMHEHTPQSTPRTRQRADVRTFGLRFAGDDGLHGGALSASPGAGPTNRRPAADRFAAAWRGGTGLRGIAPPPIRVAAGVRHSTLRLPVHVVPVYGAGADSPAGTAPRRRQARSVAGVLRADDPAR